MSESLGEILSQARRAHGKSLLEAEEATRVRAKSLEALERGEYDALPAPAYVRGYIISYAKFLELDPAPLLAQFSEETGHRTNREAMRLPEEVVPARDQSRVLPYRTVLLIVAVIALLALAVYGVVTLASQPAEQTPLPPVPETTATTEPSETPAVVPTETTTEETVTPEAGQPFTLRIDIASDGASWLRVTIDGLTAYEGILTGGDSKEWDVTESTTIRIGQPSAVTVFRDGEPVAIPTNANTPELTLSVNDTQ